jgi:purine-binding chemotaxis protein CheW
MSETGTKPRELVAFSVGGQEFCIDVMSVREIRGWAPVTPLPHAPAYVRGLMNLRGTVLPIVDVGARLGLAQTETPLRRVIVVVWIDAQLVGLLVDAVLDILTVSPDALQPTPDVGCETIEPFVTAVLTVEERMVCLLALKNLLPEDDAKAA